MKYSRATFKIDEWNKVGKRRAAVAGDSHVFTI
jgi:hypothetical protein